MIAVLFAALFSFKSCTEVLSKHSQGTSPFESHQIQMFDSTQNWDDKLFWSLTQGVFGERLYSSQLSVQFKPNQTAIMTYMSDSCGLIEWIGRLNPVQQEWYLPHIPEKVLCAHWSDLRDGIGRTPSTWNGCIISEHAKELSKYAQKNGFSRNEALMARIKDSTFARRELLNIRTMLRSQSFTSQDIDELKRLTRLIQSYGDSLEYGSVLSEVWASQASWDNRGCTISMVTFFISEIVPKTNKYSKSIDAAIQRVSSLSPSTQDLNDVHMIDKLVAKVFKDRFKIEESSMHSSFSGACKPSK